MAANRVSSISQADSLEKMGGFWDTHDLTDFDNLDVHFISSLPVTSGTVYKAWVDSKPVQIVVAED